MILNPIHQLEIRYSNLLDFPGSVLKIVSPFLPMTSNLKVENQNVLNARIHLYFEESHYTISILWDRIIFKSESHKDERAANNAFFEEPFLNLFRKIQELESFGRIKNVLFYSVYLNNSEPKEFKTCRKEFTNRYMNPIALEILDDFTDVGLVLDKFNDDGQTNLRLGPYENATEITKLGKNFVIQDPMTLSKLDNPGEILVYSSMENCSNFDMTYYKKMHKKAQGVIHKYWEL